LGGFAIAYAPTTLIKVVLGLVLLLSAAKIAYHARTPQANREIRLNQRMTPYQDTPLDAFALLPLRATVAVTVALVSVSAVASVVAIEQANAMRGMVMGLGQIGYADPGSMGAVGFLAMWTTMMAAMMLPTIVPVVLAHHAAARRRWDNALSTPAFVAGYMLVWSAIGIVVWLAYRPFAYWGDEAAQSQWLAMLAGAIFCLAGVYQFTRLKRHCADMCRSPLTFTFAHDSRGGVRHALRAGVVHGAYCLGCCWAAMMVLVAVGLMNLFAMAILFVVFLAEKNWEHGRAVAYGAGVGMMILGIAIPAFPSLLAAVSN
jgi:predicted metal-binding membrane protein